MDDIMFTAIRANLIRAGVRNLKQFGYPHVNEANILTDTVFKRFFVGMLRENRGLKPSWDEVIDKLLTEVS